ncbi:MAG: nucleotide exchange factor GrpE [Clostridia bacterium]|nr:nucleotide exchange factor GrpE [Clostridia bacterium]
MEEEKQEQEVKEENKQTAEAENKDLNDKADEIIKLKQELEEKDDRLKRLMAEFENYKKRSSKERDFLYGSILSDIVSSLLPVLDNLENAANAETADESYKQGVELVLKQFKDVLSANNVKEIEAVGQTFDPELHEAVSSVVDENLGEKVVKEVYRKGYKIGNKVIRHAMVVVAN